MWLYVFLTYHFLTGTSAQCPTAQPKTPTGNETAIACNGGSSFCTNGVRETETER